jgi:hypothetical protein
MARTFIPYRRTGTTIPRTQGMVVKTGETFKKGSPVVTDVNGLLTGCAAGAKLVTGVALQAAFTGPGYDISDSARTNTLIQGSSAKISVAIADREQEFSGAAFSTGGTVAVNPAQTNVDEKYGVAFDANGVPYIDLDNVVDLCVQITDVPDTTTNLWVFKFLEDVLARP